MNENSENYPLLSAVLCASFYPHLVQVLRPDQHYLKISSGTVLSVPKPHQLKFLTETNEAVITLIRNLFKNGLFMLL